MATIDSTSPLPDATLGGPYSFQFTGSGGFQPYLWSVGVGGLPPGMTMDTDGVLTGVPTATGLYTFDIILEEDINNPLSGPPTSATFQLTVLSNTSSPTITTVSLPGGTIGTAYNQTLAATDGTPPYVNWSITSGTLPTGLTLNASTGQITGTPSANGAFPFIVTVTDSVSQTATKNLSITITSFSTPVITTTVVPDGNVGTPYSTTVLATSGSEPYTWAVIGGALPPGLAINPATGVISGNPTTLGVYNFTVEVTDANLQTDTQVLQINIVVPTPPIITTTSLPNGVQGVSYSQAISVSGGVLPLVSFTITSGSLPPGLSIANGIISGTPTLQGTFTFDVTVTDSDMQSDSQTLSITIDSPPLPESDCCYCVFTDQLVTFENNAGGSGILTSIGGTVISNTQWQAPSQVGVYSVTLTVGANSVSNTITVVAKPVLQNSTSELTHLKPGDTIQLFTNYDGNITWTSNCEIPLVTANGRVVISTSCQDKCFGAIKCTLTGTVTGVPGATCDLSQLPGATLTVEIDIQPTFPTPDCCGPRYLKLSKQVDEYSVITHTFEGNCQETHIRSTNPVERWTINYNGLNYTTDSIGECCPSCGSIDCTVHADGCSPYLQTAKRLDQFWKTVNGQYLPFTFTDPQTNITYFNVRFERADRDHTRYTTSQARTFNLVYFPCCSDTPEECSRDTGCS